MKIFSLQGIRWDTNGEDVMLPESMTLMLDDPLSTEEDAIDKATDMYGFLIFGCDSISEL